MSSPRILRVGIIGAGEVAQVIHLPNLALLSHLYTVLSICDISPQTVLHCQKKFKIPHGTTNPNEIISNPNIDVIFILTSDQYHAPYTIAALKSGKNVMLEKPLTLSLESGLAMVAAEKEANGPRIFVGTMRRYAPSFLGAFKREIASIPRILYARSRGIVGPNAHFVSQSGTFPVKYDDIPESARRKFNSSLQAILEEELGGKEGTTKERVEYLRFLGSLGSHDLSLMREVLGTPVSIAGVSVNEPFYTAIFNYKNPSGERFSCTYESGIDNVPRFDSHLAIYGENKTVEIRYDSPYVKGLPIKVFVDELVDGEAVRRVLNSSFEDCYTKELEEMWGCFVEGKRIKTNAEDSLEDLKLWRGMLRKFEEGKRGSSKL